MSYRFSGPRRALGLLLLASVGSGCGSGDAIGVKKVTGRVTYRGEPVGGALVMFKPKGAGARVASGTTTPDGSFELITSGAVRNGAMPGDYDVLISKVVDVDAKGNPIAPVQPEYNPTARPQERPKQKSMIPEKYNAPKAPLLSATVGDRDNTFTFDLTD